MVNDPFGNTGNANFTATILLRRCRRRPSLGYNWQSGSYVVGIEGERSGPASRATMRQRRRGRLSNRGDRSGQPSLGGTIRARGGFTVDRWLMFFNRWLRLGDIAPPTPIRCWALTGSPVHANGPDRGRRLRLCDHHNVIGKFEYRYYNFNATTVRVLRYNKWPVPTPPRAPIRW